mmetsp:Transcript_29729/g.88276  ORF Transcript_29729/g.88276 Transcript_29729/m.88276 type:complete len:208 (-) Transcript_29729:169-792(-)
MVSICSSMVREMRTALRVPSSRFASQSSFFSRSSASSVLRRATILSTAAMTSSKWPEACMRAESCARRVSLVAARAPLISLMAAVLRMACVVIDSWRKRKVLSWEENDFLKRSRLSSLCRMEIALLMAASSPERSAWRTFHSSFLAVRADCTCVMYFLSFVTWSSRVSFSSTDCSRDMPLAPPSLLMSLREVLAVSSSSFLDSISLL